MAKVDLSILSDNILTAYEYNVMIDSLNFLHDAIRLRGVISMSQSKLSNAATDDNHLTKFEMDDFITVINSIYDDLGITAGKINSAITDQSPFNTVINFTTILTSLNNLYDESENIGINTKAIEFNYKYGGLSTIQTISDGVLIVSRIDNFGSLPENNNGYFLASYGGFTIDGDYIIGTGDNIAPYNHYGVNIGANHGWICDYTTVSGHDKNFVDIGSIWTNGSINWVLYGISGDVLRFINEGSTRVGLPTGTLTHVSGATNTSSIVVNGTSLGQLYPSVGERSYVVEIDGADHAVTTDGLYYAEESIRMKEVYYVYDRASLVTEIKTFAGTLSANFTDIIATQDVRITNDYIIDKYGTISTPMRWEAMRDLTSFKYIRFLQQQNILTSAVSDYFYIPDMIPFTQDSINYDFSGREYFKQFPSTINLSSGKLGTKIPNRQSMAKGTRDAIYTHGFLPTKSATEALRPLMTQQAGYLSTSEKFYMYGTHSDAVGESVAEVTLFDVDAYKVIAKLKTERTQQYYVKDFATGDVYMYADWHDLPKTDTLPIRTDLIGSSATIIEKSPNVTATVGVLNSGLDVSITNTQNYGYLVLKIS